MSQQDKLFLVIDVQNDFCPGGALAVSDGDQIVPVINALLPRFTHTILTQDWHPAGHLSFASSQKGKKPYDQIELDYGSQTLWPDHCVQGSQGAEFHGDLNVMASELIIRKGFRPAIDSYSAFFENDQTTPTGLGGYLMERGFNHLYLAGLATDFCVGFSALDAVRLGFKVTLIDDACRAIDLGGSLDAMYTRLNDAGVTRIASGDL